MNASQIVAIKNTFDNKLPRDYNKIKPASGMCGYWSIVYCYLFTQYGFKCKTVNINVNGESYFHVITRVYIDDYNYVDLDREKCELGDGCGSSPLIESWAIEIHRDLGALAKLSLEPIPSLSKVQRNSKIYVDKKTLSLLINYVDNFVAGRNNVNYPVLVHTVSKKKYLDLTREDYRSTKSKVYGRVFKGQKQVMRLLGIKNR